VNEAEIARLPPASLESQVRRAWDESLRLQEHNHRLWESKTAFSEQMRPTFPEGLGGSPNPDIEFAHIIEHEFPEGPEGSLDPDEEFQNIIEREFPKESSE
ncbi:MAG: hypothetical protein J2P36_19605, partial [Ktedonobacteraceae bacterium]|nr:hypothetical protein [Ktedonobacteraceae bacterium]